VRACRHGPRCACAASCGRAQPSCPKRQQEGGRSCHDVWTHAHAGASTLAETCTHAFQHTLTLRGVVLEQGGQVERPRVVVAEALGVQPARACIVCVFLEASRLYDDVWGVVGGITYAHGRAGTHTHTHPPCTTRRCLLTTAALWKARGWGSLAGRAAHGQAGHDHVLMSSPDGDDRGPVREAQRAGLPTHPPTPTHMLLGGSSSLAQAPPSGHGHRSHVSFRKRLRRSHARRPPKSTTAWPRPRPHAQALKPTRAQGRGPDWGARHGGGRGRSGASSVHVSSCASLVMTVIS
jgi:hypothetical protein